MEISLGPCADGTDPVEALASASGLSKTRIKLAMNRGAVWHARAGKIRRLRRAKARLKEGDEVTLYYNADVLDTVPPEPACLVDRSTYSVWFKPAGLLCGGSRFGDHCAINRWVEHHFDRPVFLVHRLDRQTEGVMLLAHTKKVAAHFSAQFQRRAIDKTYVAEVEGLFPPSARSIEAIEKQPAESVFRLLRPLATTSIVEAYPLTGRQHQIRIHLAGLGHPLVGDVAYGAAAREKFRLTATRLGYICPISGHMETTALPPEYNQFVEARQ